MRSQNDISKNVIASVIASIDRLEHACHAPLDGAASAGTVGQCFVRASAVRHRPPPAESEGGCDRPGQNF
jgi:hypothetical protein